MTDEEWRAEALCAQIDPELWFPVLGQDTTRQAKSICNGTPHRPPCPVRDECLADALATDDRFGVRGGMSPNERKKLSGWQRIRVRRDRLSIDHGTEAGAKAHYRRGEKPCQACLDGQRRSQQGRRAGGAS